MSEHVEQAMDRLLGSPTTCPHGNPIPGSAYVEPDVPPARRGRRRRGLHRRGGSPRSSSSPRDCSSSSRPARCSRATPARSPRRRPTARSRSRSTATTSASAPSPAPASWSTRDAAWPRGPALALCRGARRRRVRRDHRRDARRRPPFRRRPTSTAADPLAALSAETAALSAALIDNDGQREALARIEELWGGLRPEIAEQRPDLLEGFDAVIQLVRRSVERRRPADADKAHKNLLTLIAAYEG